MEGNYCILVECLFESQLFIRLMVFGSNVVRATYDILGGVNATVWEGVE